MSAVLKRQLTLFRNLHLLPFKVCQKQFGIELTFEEKLDIGNAEEENRMKNVFPQAHCVLWIWCEALGKFGENKH